MEDVPSSKKLGIEGSELNFNGTRLLQLIGLITAIELIFGKPSPFVILETKFYDAIALFL